MVLCLVAVFTQEYVDPSGCRVWPDMAGPLPVLPTKVIAEVVSSAITLVGLTLVLCRMNSLRILYLRESTSAALSMARSATLNWWFWNSMLYTNCLSIQ